MNGRVKLSEIVLVLLLIGALTLAFNVQQAKAPGTSDGGVCTVCIRADGSVDPPTASIQRDGNIYTLTGNITCDVFSDGIVIERSDMVLDGAGYTLQGISGSDQVNGALSGRGITVSGRSNVTIRNITVTRFAWGILLLVHCFNNSIVGNTITNNGDTGLSLDHSRNNSIVGNNITTNNIGIHVCSSANNSLYHNNFIDNFRHVDLTTPSYANSWDDGYPSGGNYWTGYTRTDLCSGADQNVNGSDGIVDITYVFDENNRDRYPLMNPDPAPIQTNDPVLVGGICIPIPINKPDLLTPYIALVSMILIAAATIAVYVKVNKKEGR